MKPIARGAALVSVLAGLVAAVYAADDQAPKRNKAESYFNFSMGHVYAELAAAYGNRGDFLSRAIEHYKAALAADPEATFISEELAGLYIQAGKVREAVLELEERIKKDPKSADARRVLGRLYARLIGDPESNRINEEMLRRAVEQYQKVVELDPKDVDSWVLLGRLYRIGQDSVEAEKAFKKALELDPSNDDALTELALVYSNSGENQQAVELWKKIAERNPNRRNLVALAGAYEDMRDYKSAAQVLERALALDPENLEVKRMLGQTLIFAGSLDRARQTFEDIVAADPRDAQSFLRISQIYRQQREFAKARDALNRAKELEPDNLEIRYGEVSLLEEEGKRAEAIAVLKQILDSTERRSYSGPDRANRAALLERLALLYRANQQYPQAVETFQALAALDGSLAARAAAQVVETYRMARDYSRAEAESDAAVKKFPDDRMVILSRATLLAELGRADQAVAEAKKLFGNGDDKEAWLNLAQIYERSKNYEGMRQALDAYEKLAGDNEDRSTLYFMRGAMYERLKKYDEAEAEFRKALAIDPDNASVLNYLGYMLADRNVRLDEAHRLISRALELEPGNGAYLDSLGWVYYRMDQLEQAERYLRLALNEVPHDPTVRDHLGDVLAKQGRLKEAIEEWQLSLKEWEAGPPVERDAAEIAKINRKLEGAKIRMAQETSGSKRKP